MTRAIKGTLMMIGALLCASTVTHSGRAVAATPQGRNVVESMFIWWNGAMSAPGALTPEGFRQFFTEDAEIIVNDRVVAKGIPGFIAHFEKIRARDSKVQKGIPFRETFQKGDVVYGYQLTLTLSAKGELSCALTAGHAKLKNGRIQSYVTVRAAPDLPASTREPDCVWKGAS